MRHGLFIRLFTAFTVSVVVIVALFSGIMAVSMQKSAQESYEQEVLTQAREVAAIMTYFDQISSIGQNMALQRFLNEKIAAIWDDYTADIWLVSYSAGRAQVLDGHWHTSDEFYTEAVLAQLAIIESGMEINVQGLFNDLGNDIVTIGVPWKYEDGTVVGAVLLHISVESLEVDYRDLASRIWPVSIFALTLGIALAYFIARSQTRPVKAISSAMSDFTRGNFNRRVQLSCGGELEQLGDSFNRMAEELAHTEESRRAFVANVSHELRSPLTSMRGYVQGIMDGTIPAQDEQKYLQVVMDETNRLTSLVNELLDLSRIESGKFPMKLSKVDINELIARTLFTFETRINEKNIDVQVDFCEPAPMVTADAQRIQQVVSNLIDNAVKFIDAQGGVLTIGTQPQGNGICVYVQDNGPGIAPEDINHIFDRFYKADKAHSGKGTGLGLSICSHIVALHQSQLQVQSQPQKTVFRFVLKRWTQA